MRQRSFRSHRSNHLRHRFLGVSIALVTAAALAPVAVAEPQAAGMLAPMDEATGTSRGKDRQTTDATNVPQSTARTPKKPESPPDNSWLAPPLPGYVIMFLLGAAVVTLNLWSSKRTQLD